MQRTSEHIGCHGLQSILDSPMQRSYALAETNVNIKPVIGITYTAKYFVIWCLEGRDYIF